MSEPSHEVFPPNPLPHAGDNFATALQAGGQVNSAALLGTRNQLIIQHLDEHYILRQTRAGKLILTK